MEDVRYAASFAAGPSNKDKIKELGDKHQNLRHVKEKSEGSQELVQRIEQGLAHIAELLGKYKCVFVSVCNLSNVMLCQVMLCYVMLYDKWSKMLPFLI